ncbi:MAG: succinylglutamate desuccinylase/aspartoacylase family protein [bacterium]|nr:succinylglutamate desuccinylase/aspartoacylase family protein [bacterium]
MKQIKNNKNFDIKITGDGKPVISVVSGIHGDESVGKKIIKTLRKINPVKGTLVTIVANPFALRKRKRFIDADLNRCFPGKRNGNYEERIAFHLSETLKQADFVIDIHSTTTDVKDLVIIKEQNSKIDTLINYINPRRTVFMPKGIGDGSLINHCPAGVSFEYGPHKSMYTYRRCLQDIKRILFKLNMTKENITRKKFITDRYKIYGTVEKPRGITMRKNIKNFTLIREGEILGRVKDKSVVATEKFYPILFGPKAYKDIMGFKAKKIAG